MFLLTMEDLQTDLQKDHAPVMDMLVGEKWKTPDSVTRGTFCHCLTSFPNHHELSHGRQSRQSPLPQSTYTNHHPARYRLLNRAS
jgi:hypothetical protein